MDLRFFTGSQEGDDEMDAQGNARWHALIDVMREDGRLPAEGRPSLVDVGCHYGGFLNVVKERTGAIAVGVDPLDTARFKARARGLHVVDNISKLVRGTADNVTCIDVLYVVPNLTDFLFQLMDLMRRPGGRIYIVHRHHPESPAWAAEPLRAVRHVFGYYPMQILDVAERCGLEVMMRPLFPSTVWVAPVPGVKLASAHDLFAYYQHSLVFRIRPKRKE